MKTGILILNLACTAIAHSAISDAVTSLLLKFDGSSIGADGEAPAGESGVTFGTGVGGQAALLGSPNQLFHARSGNIDPQQGTLEFWIKPSWAGNDGQGHFILKMGAAGGMLFGKDGANNWRCIFNRFSANGQPERGVAVNIGTWQAGGWHHAAFTWGGGELRLYLDGVLKTSTTVPALPDMAATTFQIGGDGSGSYIDAAIDELRISSVPRTEQEIQQNYFADVTGLSSLTVSPTTWTGWPAWHLAPTLTATTSLGQMSVPPGVCSWTTTNSAVAIVDAAGTVQAVGPGTATLAATVGGLSASIAITINAPALPPDDLAIDPALSAAAADALHEMPVAIITYLPTLNGVNVDATEGGTSASLAAMRSSILTMNKRVKFMLEEGSRFRGYQNALARPSLGYRVVKNLIVYEPLPPGKPTGGGAWFPDYNQILARWGGRQLVEQQGVKEFWIWGYHTSKIVPVESNMSSPTTGDISNSSRFSDDLPVYDRTYVLYNYNFSRSQAEAVHNHGHQLEAILSHVNQLQDGNTSLFWDKFCGRNTNGSFQPGRCGNAHFPPNAGADYDYTNATLVLSDCEDWKPDGTGTKKQVSAQTWGGLSYAWPGGTSVPQKTESQYYIYWMQNMPGHRNGIRMGTRVLRNWWEFTADWDRAIREARGLHKAPEVSLHLQPPTPPSDPVWRLRVGGDAGYSWLVESSTDLRSWAPLSSGMPFTGEISITDPSAASGTSRFYRAALTP